MTERRLPTGADGSETGVVPAVRTLAAAASPRPSVSEMNLRIRQFTEEAKRFSRDFSEVAGPEFTQDPVRSSLLNVELAKSLFSKWVIEILLTLYARGEIGFQELRRALCSISPRILSQKLRLLEGRKLVRRTVLSTRPARVHYALTDDGLVLASLGEPVFIFLRHRPSGAPAGRRRAGSLPGVAGRRPTPRARVGRR
jgi:DNA-binding HxlR family transcriptional regulator